MLTVFSEKHLLHGGLPEPASDHWEPGAECPERASTIISAINGSNLGEVVAPEHFDDSHLLAVHDADYIKFLASAWDEWVASGEAGAIARPYTFVTEGMRATHTESVYGKLGRYAFDIFAPIGAGSWQAIRTAADVALTAAQHITAGETSAFAVCRPPGHHASRDRAGGYCYLNNCAIAAQAFIDDGSERIAILDVDYHHGNGTQAIFYDRSDVLTISLHADPTVEYPYYIGYADERGTGNGLGFNRNYPLPLGSRWAPYCNALMDALQRIQNYAPDVVIVAFGLDTYAMDRTTNFAIQSADFSEMGKIIGSLNMPILVVLEGGYDVATLGMNTLHFLTELEAAGS